MEPFQNPDDDARAAGMAVVMDLCLMVEHARLLGRSWVRD